MYVVATVVEVLAIGFFNTEYISCTASGGGVE